MKFMGTSINYVSLFFWNHIRIQSFAFLVWDRPQITYAKWVPIFLYMERIPKQFIKISLKNPQNILLCNKMSYKNDRKITFSKKSNFQILQPDFILYVKIWSILVKKQLKIIIKKWTNLFCSAKKLFCSVNFFPAKIFSGILVIFLSKKNLAGKNSLSKKVFSLSKKGYP